MASRALPPEFGGREMTRRGPNRRGARRSASPSSAWILALNSWIDSPPPPSPSPFLTAIQRAVSLKASSWSLKSIPSPDALSKSTLANVSNRSTSGSPFGGGFGFAGISLDAPAGCAETYDRISQPQHLRPLFVHRGMRRARPWSGPHDRIAGAASACWPYGCEPGRAYRLRGGFFIGCGMMMRHSHEKSILGHLWVTAFDPASSEYRLRRRVPQPPR